ncbi:DUF1694 domain-containing protein [Lactobacillus sp. S2-2]|uniref:YueI family protein n=1 Tax=Lactobacillus sp. S2-2 TaxID=2692917 RepID=UPI001F3CAC3E|nr:YueI family protein [Lactobacillus sp. S2-2]MCF6515783.1 DUF1694 domain-containing protein [Lactobacillus sp. S2-2]
MANNDSLQNRLDNSMNGSTPQINPDEQHKFLGTFAERVDFAIKKEDINNIEAQQILKKEINDHNDYQLLLNGTIGQSSIMTYIKLASSNNIKFTQRNDKIYEKSPFGVVFVSEKAINQENYIFKPSDNKVNIEDKPARKKTFLSRLFNKK